MITVILLVTSLALAAGGWPAWRGPLANGTAPGAKPPVRWSEKENVRWKAAIPGKGSSTPCVLDGLVIVTAAVDTGVEAKPEDRPAPIKPPAGTDPDSPRYKRMTRPTNTYHHFLAVAYGLEDGKEKWRATLARGVPHEGHHPTHSYAAGSPCTDGRRVYVSFGSFGTHALTLDGKVAWSRDLGKLETRLGWGEAVTPLFHGGKLFVAHDHEGGSFLACLDAGSGKVLWKKPRDEPSNWTTPAVARLGERDVILLTGANKCRGYDAQSGKEVLTQPGLTLNAIPSVVVHEGVAYFLAGYRGSSGYALKLSQPPEVLWKLDRGLPYVPSPAISSSGLWFTAANDPLLTAIDLKTGKPFLDRVRVPGLRQLYASPLIADGRVYLSDREGTTAVLKEGRKLEVLATNKIGEALDASPVAVGKKLLLRSSGHLWCIEEAGR